MTTTETQTRFRIGHRVGLLAAAVGLWAVVTACSSSGGKKPTDGAVLDSFSIDYTFGDLPPGCPPAAGNEKGIGNPCSNGGGECTGNLICACEEFNGFFPPANTPCFCTIPILGKVCSDPTIPPGYCGQNATCCSYMNLGSICVPDICLESMTCPMI